MDPGAGDAGGTIGAPLADPSNLIDDLATWASQRIAVYAEASKTVVSKVIDTEYSGDDFAADVSAGWKRLVEDVTTLLAVLPKPPTDGSS